VSDLQRQFRLALGALLIVIPTGVIGFHLIEGLDWVNALWLTFITLATIGYGDVYAKTEIGKLFTIVLIVFGLGSLASALQVSFTLFVSPEIRAMRQRRRVATQIGQLRQHYIICGSGELVDKTVGYLLAFADRRRRNVREIARTAFQERLPKWLAKNSWLYRGCLGGFALWYRLFRREWTILDIVVVVTEDHDYAMHLRSAGLLVIDGVPSHAEVLEQAGIQHARAMMVVQDSDTDTLLTVLTARHGNRVLPITAAVLDDTLGQKIVRIGANNVLTHFELAGQFLNNATFRPAVNDYFNSLLFDNEGRYILTQVELREHSSWIGKTIEQVHLERYVAYIIGIQQTDGTFLYAPPVEYLLQEDEVLILVTEPSHIAPLQQAAEGSTLSRQIASFQPIHYHNAPPRGSKSYTLVEAESTIQTMTNHYIICGSDRVARSAIDSLNPDRPFVIISNDNALTAELLRRGFRVVHGSPIQEATLLRAGIKRAQAIMVSLEAPAEVILTILTSRTLNKRLLITATALSDDMVPKLELAGADRVVSPFHVAARFMLLATTRPQIYEFLTQVIFNYRTGIETTELYMEETSPWIGKKIAALLLREKYDAGIIGIRLADGETYLYAPPLDYTLGKQEVLIVTIPMRHSDEIRAAAHGGTGRAPATLRRSVMQSDQWSRDILKELIEQRGGQ
jgi:voltage-gated potassium channel